METKTYYVGDRPAGQWTFSVLNQYTGQPVNLQVYSSARVVMLDSDNRTVELSPVNTTISNAELGEVTFFWPTETLFTSAGRYVMQIELSSETSTRKTSVQEILVRELGRVVK